MILRFFYILAVFQLSLSANAQLLSEGEEQFIDSLKQAISTTESDTIKVNAYQAWDNLIYAFDPELDLELNLKILEICNENINNPYISGKLELFFKIKKANTLNNLGLINRYDGNFDESLNYFKQSMELQIELKSTEGQGNTLNNIGLLYSDRAELENALKYFEQAMEKYVEIDSKSGMAMVNNNIGILYYKMGDIPVALEYYYKELKLEEEENNLDGIASSYNNIAILHAEVGDTLKALEFFQKVKETRVKIGDQHGIASSTHNIGMMYESKGDFSKALALYFEAVAIYERIGNKTDLGETLSNIAQVYQIQKNYGTAIRYCLESLKILEGIENPQTIAQSYSILASIYFVKGDIDKSKESGLKSLEIAMQIGYPKEIQNAAKVMADIYEIENNGMKALEMHKLYIEMRDSLQSIKNKTSTYQQEAQYEYDKQKAIDDAEHDKIVAIQEEEKARQRVIIYAVISGLILLAGFLIFVFNRLSVTRKQKNEINNQKEEIAFQHEQLELNHNEIKDSITYAKRLQKAILPSLNEITKHIPENFIYFRPKDVVSGDFYWFKKINSTIYVAAADCTGHGVPGAMVSVVCSNALNRAVKEYGLTKPSDILNKTRELVVQQFSLSGTDVQDGMDISLCAFNGNTMTFSGANNPVWVIKQTDKISEDEKSNSRNIIQGDKTLIEIKGDRKPVAKYRDMSPFSDKNLELEDGDMIYLFSDGFSDQFGGESIADKKGGKKFKYKPFKQFLLSIHQLEMGEQKEHLDRTFDIWKGDFEQVDDVCIIGLKF